jgi:hypothetical protein
VKNSLTEISRCDLAMRSAELRRPLRPVPGRLGCTGGGAVTSSLPLAVVVVPRSGFLLALRLATFFFVPFLALFFLLSLRAAMKSSVCVLGGPPKRSICVASSSAIVAPPTFPPSQGGLFRSPSPGFPYSVPATLPIHSGAMSPGQSPRAAASLRKAARPA